MIGKRVFSYGLWAVTLPAACGLMPLACAQGFRITAHRARCIIVLLDETGSDIADFDAMRQHISTIAERLSSDDAFAVIAINDHAGEADNVRVDLTSLHAGPLEMAKLNQQRDKIVQQVKSLKPQGHPKFTDVVGAIRQARDVASQARAISAQTNSHMEMNVVLTFFSDMQQTPHMPTPSDFQGIQFPEGTKAYCYYVAAPGKKGIDSTRAIWRPLLNSAGISITDNDFNQKGTVDAAINSTF
jgi:hypothetical protein